MNTLKTLLCVLSLFIVPIIQTSASTPAQTWDSNGTTTETSLMTGIEETRKTLKKIRKWKAKYKAEIKLAKCFSNYWKEEITGLRNNDQLRNYYLGQNDRTGARRQKDTIQNWTKGNGNKLEVVKFPNRSNSVANLNRSCRPSTPSCNQTNQAEEERAEAGNSLKLVNSSNSDGSALSLGTLIKGTLNSVQRVEKTEREQTASANLIKEKNGQLDKLSTNNRLAQNPEILADESSNSSVQNVCRPSTLTCKQTAKTLVESNRLKIDHRSNSNSSIKDSKTLISDLSTSSLRVQTALANLWSVVQNEIYSKYLRRIWEHTLVNCIWDYSVVKFWAWIDSAPD